MYYFVSVHTYEFLDPCIGDILAYTKHNVRILFYTYLRILRPKNGPNFINPNAHVLDPNEQFHQMRIWWNENHQMRIW